MLTYFSTLHEAGSIIFFLFYSGRNNNQQKAQLVQSHTTFKSWYWDLNLGLSTGSNIRFIYLDICVGIFERM